MEKNGAAFNAGLREGRLSSAISSMWSCKVKSKTKSIKCNLNITGDVILSINGQNMARMEHGSLVSFIRKCPTHLKMVVISDERARKVISQCVRSSWEIKNE